jgi:hypothetical protein
MEPGGDGAAAGEARQGSPNAGEDLLSEVSGVGFVAGQAAQEGEDRRVKAIDEILGGAREGATDGFDQLVDIGFHSRSLG